MANIKNTYGINSITMDKGLTLFCPMGNAPYDVQLHITIVPAEEIMDYCETDQFLSDLSGKHLIIEELVQQVHEHIMGAVHPYRVDVEAKVFNAAHMPVTVSKLGVSDTWGCDNG